MIIVAGKTIQEVKDQLNHIEDLAEQGYICGIGGETLDEVREMSNRLDLPIRYEPPEAVTYEGETQYPLEPTPDEEVLLRDMLFNLIL